MGLTEFLTIINDGTNGLFGVSILLFIALIVYARNRFIEPTKEGITGAAWAALLVSFFLRYLELINDWIFGVTIIVALGSIVMLINKE